MDELENRRREKLRDELIAGLRTRLEHTHPPDEVEDLVANAETFSSWDLNYDAGSLTLYRTHDIDEYLLEWCPRKLSFPPEAWLGVLDGLVTYLEFLGDSGRWRGPASGARAVAAHAREQTTAFLDAMADPSKYGMAKSMLMGPALAGAEIDFDDPASMQAVVDRFNSLSFEERKALTDGPFMSSAHAREAAERRARASFAMPAVRLPSPAALVASAAQSRLYLAVTELRDYLGEKGVALTQKGNLKLVDCRALVDQLGTGDSFEYGPPGSTSAVRSMDELHWLSWVFDVGLEAGAYRRVKGRLVPVKRWHTDPVEAATSLAAVSVALVQHGMHPWFDQLEEVVASGLPYLLAPAMGFGISLSLEEMTEFALAAADIGPRPQWMTADSMKRAVGRSVRDRIELMAFAGVVAFADEAVTMTPFGVQFMVDTMRSNGFVVPELPTLDRLSAGELLASIVDATVFAGPAAWVEWQPEWPDERKCGELVDALLDVPVELRSAHQRYGAFALLAAAPTSAAHPALARCLGTIYAGYAATAMARHGLPVPGDDADIADELDGLMDLPSVMLPWVDECYLDITVDGPDAVEPAVDELFDGTSPEVLESLAFVPVHEVTDVLEAIGSSYPDKRVAKAARTVLHKWRSRHSR